MNIESAIAVKDDQGIIIFKTPSDNAVPLTKLAVPMKTSFPSDAARPEVTPVIFTVNGSSYMTVPTAWTMICGFTPDSKPSDAWSNTCALSQTDWWLACDSESDYGACISGLKDFPATETFNAPALWNEGQPYWSRIYYSVFDVGTAEVNGERFIFTVNHGENKNEKYHDGRMYSNTIQPRPATGIYADDRYSGVTDGVYNDYPDGYFAFTGMSVMPESSFVKGVRFDPTGKFDKGPIVWPSEGYIDSANKRVTDGLRHPSLFIDKSYIYVYYLDKSRVRVARSPVASLGEPGSFEVFSGGSFSLRSLPRDFDKSSRSFFQKGIGAPTAILGENSKSIRFSVSKLKNTQYYLGAEEYYTEWPQGGIRLRLSRDLVNWSEPFHVPDGEWPDNEYNKGTLHYPLIYNSNFSCRSEIDPDDFYIVGQYGNNIGTPRTEAVHFSLQII